MLLLFTMFGGIVGDRRCGSRGLSHDNLPVALPPHAQHAISILHLTPQSIATDKLLGTCLYDSFSACVVMMT
jgi:hypothetical protein